MPFEKRKEASQKPTMPPQNKSEKVFFLRNFGDAGVRERRVRAEFWLKSVSVRQRKETEDLNIGVKTQ